MASCPSLTPAMIRQNSRHPPLCGNLPGQGDAATCIPQALQHFAPCFASTITYQIAHAQAFLPADLQPDASANSSAMQQKKCCACLGLLPQIRTAKGAAKVQYSRANYGMSSISCGTSTVLQISLDRCHSGESLHVDTLSQAWSWGPSHCCGRF